MAALLFKLSACVQLELNKVACTSKLCAWKKSRTKAHPASLCKIDFKRPKKNATLPKVERPVTYCLSGFTAKDPFIANNKVEMDSFIELKEIAPNAAVFTSISSSSTSIKDSYSDTDTDDENDSNDLPEPFTFLYDPSAIKKSDEDIKRIGEIRYYDYCRTTSPRQYQNLLDITERQSLSGKWFLHRAGRITASISKAAFNTSPDQPGKSFLWQVMQYNDCISVPATKYGSEKEPSARKHYINIVKQTHANLTVSITGLHVNPDFPCLGASPDGIVECRCHGRGLLEIKCPFKYRDGLSGWREEKNCPIAFSEEMKKNHQYFFQVQHQMLVTNTKYCDFFVWTQGSEQMIPFS